MDAGKMAISLNLTDSALRLLTNATLHPAC
jgi:hypothetical protein